MGKYWFLEIDKQIGILSFKNPPKNFLNMDIMNELNLELDSIENDSKILVLLIKSDIPEAFISGVDVKIFKEYANDQIMEFIEISRSVFNKIENLSKPVIAVIDGFCLGGGCEFAVSCDIKIASIKAKFGFPEIIYGLIPGGGVIRRLSRLITRGQAMKMLLTGFTINAEQSLDIGLIDEMCSEHEVMNNAFKIAERITKNSPLLIKTIKNLINQSIYHDKDFFQEIEIKEIKKIFTSFDFKEGLLAFFERRSPDYKNK